jgi:hypothetical protein
MSGDALTRGQDETVTDEAANRAFLILTAKTPIACARRLPHHRTPRPSPLAHIFHIALLNEILNVSDDLFIIRLYQNGTSM